MAIYANISTIGRKEEEKEEEKVEEEEEKKIIILLCWLNPHSLSG